jgi:hypothetical protein
MKRSVFLLLTAIYLISCLGISVNRFYCCGKLASVTYTYGAGDNINNQANKKNKCCDHQKQSFKVKDSHFSAASISLNHPVPAIISSFISLTDEPVVGILHTKIVYKGNAPPGHSDIPIYTLNCTYRI